MSHELLRRRVVGEFGKQLRLRSAATEKRVFALERIAPDGSERVLCLHNVSPETVSVEVVTPIRRKQWGNLASLPAVEAASEVLKLALQPHRSAWLVGA
jgi:hypothetical protein